MNQYFTVLVLLAVAFSVDAELMGRFNDGEDFGDYMVHQKRLSYARHSLVDALNALERLSASPVVSNGKSMIDSSAIDSVKRSVGSLAHATFEEEKRVCVVNLGGACNAEDALKNARMRAFLDSANGPGRR